ncbi:flagellar hook-length control protein FliK [Pseudidiomarina sp. GXY010]|uniref:Flagellar hook-length control protein FliK n=1 Tax=Pseudidiomarina fusca TaxID=2965078 RepID=A0ABU3KYQ4_9GAMM|nr:flagellar hook-length control protein FliK [Pseudidiomarina sp. GXY010]MDT7526586.1 flagellar hook-length control protein FliK [Pseudidiomarina sp. GXY010]
MVQISSVIAAVPVSPRTTGTKDASGTELGSTGADSGFAGLFAALQLPAQTATSKNPDLTQQVARSGSQLPQFSAPALLANLGVAADLATGNPSGAPAATLFAQTLAANEGGTAALALASAAAHTNSLSPAVLVGTQQATNTAASHAANHVASKTAKPNQVSGALTAASATASDLAGVKPTLSAALSATHAAATTEAPHSSVANSVAAALASQSNQAPADNASPQLATGTLASTAAPAAAGSTLTAPAIQVMLTDASNLSSASTSSAQLTASVGSQAWANQLSQSMVQIVMHNGQQMTLKLHPAELGPLQMQLQLDERNQAQLAILTHSGAVRAALEQALPQLRDTLANQGIQLQGSQVSEQSNHASTAQQFAGSGQSAAGFAQQDRDQGRNNSQINPAEIATAAENTDREANSRHTAASASGAVDTYA